MVLDTPAQADALAPLEPAGLRRAWDAAALGFATTDELEPLDEVLGQDRALQALRFGVGIRRPGFNVFALGVTGLGKHRTVRRILEKQAALEKAPSDWCYVHNFDHPNRPRALCLPAGKGGALRADMTQLVDELRAALPATFESEEYQRRNQTIDDEFEEKPESAIEALRERAKARNIALLRTPLGYALGPIRGDKVLGADDFKSLPDEEQEDIKAEIEVFEKELQSLLRKVPVWEKQHRERLRALNQEVARFAVAHLLEDLEKRYADQERVLAHLLAVREDVVENADKILGRPASPLPAALGLQAPGDGEEDLFVRYQVNVLVEHDELQGAPVVYEDHPSHQRLIGRTEHVSRFGALLTNFTLIRPGALHLANGGYLVIDARKLLSQPFSWDALKRALRQEEVRVESLGEMLSLVSTVSLEPEAIPLDLKVVLVGEPFLYYLLCALDSEFAELFKVPADFDERMEVNENGERLFARLVATIARDHRLHPFESEGVAAVLEWAAREAHATDRLTTRTSRLSDLLCEADYWAATGGRERVTRGDVQRAVEAGTYRSDRLRSRIYEEIERGSILIDASGERTGQCNALSVLQLGPFAFGRPSRITAQARPGRGEVVDIEREVELGGPIHSKGVMILAGYLGGRYACGRPLALSASLVFEQSYGSVEGDSASLAELLALLSSLADVPLRQSIAVTGSVNQHGDVQAVGGINEKIEGFYDVCARNGLDGTQGVVIPAANRRQLMLRPDVVDAARRGYFRVWAVERVDEAIELLSGRPAGTVGADGAFPQGSFNGLVAHRLRRFAQQAEAAQRALASAQP